MRKRRRGKPPAACTQISGLLVLCASLRGSAPMKEENEWGGALGYTSISRCGHSFELPWVDRCEEIVGKFVNSIRWLLACFHLFNTVPP